MNGISLLLVWASLGVVYSWRPGVDGQQEYVLQIEPEVMQQLPSFVDGIQSDVPAEAGNVQRLRIIVLPKDGTPATRTQLAEDRFRQLIVSTGRYASSDPALASDAQPTVVWPSRGNPDETFGIKVGWQPDVKGNLQYFVQLDPTLLRTLSVGDELYVPIDPAAGRPARFVVKAGKEMLPRIGGAQTQPTQGVMPTAPLTGSSRGRFPGTGDAGANSWSNWSSNQTGGLATDYAQPTRPGATDPRGGSLWNSGGNALAPRGTATSQPGNSYGDYGAAAGAGSLYPGAGSQVADGRTYGSGGVTQAPGIVPGTANNFDKYRNPDAPPYDAANSTLYPPAGNGQPLTSPQVSRNGVQQPFDTRLAAGSGVPNGTNMLGAAGVIPADMQSPKKDQPWGPFFFALCALFFSLGGNLYLAYTALEYHSRYRNAIERLRSAARSA